jgi:hypothetical protein
MIPHQDVVTALLGASAGLLGLSLVFLGLVVSAVRGFDADTPAVVLDRYRRPALAVVATALAGLAAVLLCASWLLTRDNQVLFALAVAFFYVQTVMLCGSAGYVVHRVMWS